jgi:cytochrome c553
MVAALLLLACLGARGAPPPLSDAASLFAKNCAACHGADGDGQGTTRLDRPARSFRDGGFSYGNTEDALLRTITFGIPGTPMPAFESSLSAEERAALAAFVLALGPPVEHVDPESTVIRVGARPVIVRGYLPPIDPEGPGATERPRGLLIGRPEGVTFEYRVDDVRLLGLRQGGFVERRDWTGRGGAALAPLGTVVALVEGGDPRPSFRLAGAGELEARLAGSWIEGQAAGVAYRLERDGVAAAHVREAPRPAGTSAGAGFARTFRIVAERDVELVQRLFAFGDARRADSFATAAPEGTGTTEWTVWRRPDGMHDVFGVALSGDGQSLGAEGGVYALHLRIAAGDEVRVETTLVTAYAWTPEIRARFAAEVRR